MKSITLKIIVFSTAIGALSVIAGPSDLKIESAVADRVSDDQAKLDPAYLSDAAFSNAIANANNFQQFKDAYLRKLASDDMAGKKKKKQKQK